MTRVDLQGCIRRPLISLSPPRIGSKAKQRFTMWDSKFLVKTNGAVVFSDVCRKNETAALRTGRSTLSSDLGGGDT